MRPWSEASARPARQFSKFAIVGVSNTALSFVAYVALLGVGIVYWGAGAVGFTVGAVNGYMLNRRWTFAAPDSPQARLKYVVVQLGGLGATTAFLWLFVSALDIGRVSAYLVTIPSVTVVTFLANRSWAFAGV